MRSRSLHYEDIIPAGLKQAWGEWVSGLAKWDWYVTMTFRDRPSADQARGWTRPGWAYTTKAWDSFIEELGFRKGLHQVDWVRGREYQHWRGVGHFHGLIAGVGDLRRDEAWAWWFQRYGLNRILPYDPGLGAGFYLGKYLVKEFGDIQFSQGLTSPRLRLIIEE